MWAAGSSLTVSTRVLKNKVRGPAAHPWTPDAPQRDRKRCHPVELRRAWRFARRRNHSLEHACARLAPAIDQSLTSSLRRSCRRGALHRATDECAVPNWLSPCSSPTPSFPSTAPRRLSASVRRYARRRVCRRYTGSACVFHPLTAPTHAVLFVHLNPAQRHPRRSPNRDPFHNHTGSRHSWRWGVGSFRT